MIWIIFFLVLFLIIISAKCFGHWLGLLIIVKWMDMNNMQQPSDKQREELAKWVVHNIIKDLKKI